MENGHRLSASMLETLETEIRRLRGVQRVYFNLNNWLKDSSGRWSCLEQAVSRSCDEPAHEEDDAAEVTEVAFEPRGAAASDPTAG